MTSMLDAPSTKGSAAPVLAVVGTLAAHGSLVVLASLLGFRAATELGQAQSVTQMVEVELPTPTPTAPTPGPTPTPTPLARPRHAPREAEPPPAKAAAQAGQVLAASSDVIDFGEHFVTGTGDSYAGGVTDAAGTSKSAVRDVTARGTPTSPTPPAIVVDLSRPPYPSGSAQWQCPFPHEADDAGIDHAVVSLRVEVAADGSVRSVSTSNDPGNGFGPEARRCAGSKRWGAALDRAGRPVAGVALVNVRFDR